MKIKTSDLIGPALDWAVAKCEGYINLRKNPYIYNDTRLIMDHPNLGERIFLTAFQPSKFWGQGGPIIERENIHLEYHHYLGLWEATAYFEFKPDDFEALSEAFGPAALIAAMRCYVASKLGDLVDVPEELCDTTG